MGESLEWDRAAEQGSSTPGMELAEGPGSRRHTDTPTYLVVWTRTLQRESMSQCYQHLAGLPLCCLQCCYPMGYHSCSKPTEHPAYGPNGLGTSYACGRPRHSSWLLASAWLCADHVATWEMNQPSRKSLLPSLCVTDSEISKQISKELLTEVYVKQTS